ncbi:hypothetical protein AVEN_14504-1 [Araneus ventricosus]|uniref:Uncharacterized protein n=1 Tax=Araneus ventricosus TaxID=182803 RepID=A0A4Y2CGQ6_ARAVE|nr:hypothetical protein AVEN_14504-1 [Araneus ventricosus]
MAFLAKAQKADLLRLATEIGLDAVTSARIQKEKEQKEKKEREKEREERELVTRKEREEREFAAKEKEKEREKERDHELLLKNMELETEERRIKLTTGERVKCSFDVHRLIQKFDPKVGDISLDLTLFERQVKRAKVSEELWVLHLIGLLPNDMAQLIAREPEEVTNDYEQVKQILLKRYKLSAEMFRQMFTKHSKNSDGTWKDFVYELRTYFQEWIKGLKVENFEQMCDLIIIDQMKRRVPTEVKGHFIDE